MLCYIYVLYEQKSALEFIVFKGVFFNWYIAEQDYVYEQDSVHGMFYDQ